MKVLDNVPARLETMFLHKVTGDRDTDEGRGGTYLVGYFVNLGDARKAAEAKGVWGAAGDITTENHVVVIYNDPTTGAETFRLVGDAISIAFDDPAKIRARALEKLHAAGMSLAELQALGL